MMNVKNRELLRFVQDYQVHLIDPARLSEEELAKFSTSLREVMGYIKYSKDKKKLSEFLKENPRMLIEANAARVIKLLRIRLWIFRRTRRWSICAKQSRT